MAISPGSTLIDYLVPQKVSRSAGLLRDALLVVGFSLFVALCAQVSFHIPTTPIPVTLQTLAVLLTGAALGSRRGGLALLLYLAEGAVGLPVFAGFSGSVAVLFGFTGGFLWAFPIAAFVTGLLCERGMDRNPLTCILAMLPGTLIIYAIGLPWFSIWFHLPLSVGYTAAVAPFLLGDLIKLLIAVILLPTAWLLLGMTHFKQRS